ncbi:MAG TPA: methyl-accepting chemotaxis protein [Spirochaetota bacterium]|nr:methyl-accepting chemotaxis protein [Spirochaetota bacterium]
MFFRKYKASIKIVTATFVSIVLTLSVYGIFLPIILNFSSEKSMAFFLKLAANMITLGPAATFIVFIMFKPAQKLIISLDEGKELVPEEADKVKKILNSIPNFLFVLGALSYLLGSALHYVGEFRQHVQIDMGVFYSRIIISIVWGMLNGFITARILNIFLIRIKIKLKIYTIEGKKESTLFRLFVPIYILIIFMIALFVIANYHRTNKVFNEKNNFLESVVKEDFKRDSELISNIRENDKVALKNNFKIFLGISFFFALFLGLLLFIILYEMQSYLKNLNNQIKKLNKEEINLNDRINIISFDDVGEMTSGINKIISKLSNTFIEIKKAIQNVYDSNSDMQESLSKIQNKASEINPLMKKVEENAQKQSGVIDGTIGMINNMLLGIEKTISDIEDQFGIIKRTSVKLNSLIQSINESNNKINNIDENFKNLILSIEKANSGIDEGLQSIDNISKSNIKINDIIEIISNIASQTDMLAMNAAIESAHAGEVGKGFSVVADEIRKLAENTASSTGDISFLIKEMNENISGGQKIFNNLKDIFDDMNRGMSVTTESISDIINASVNHIKESDENVKNINDMIKSSELMKKNSEYQREDNKVLAKSINTLNESIENIRSAENDLTDYVMEIILFFSGMNENFLKMSDKIKSLESQINEYKIE